MHIVISAVLLVANIYLLLLWARFFIDLARTLLRDWHPSDGTATVLGFVMVVTDPPVKLFNGLVPPLRFGGVALEFGIFLSIAAVSVLVTILNVVR